MSRWQQLTPKMSPTLTRFTPRDPRCARKGAQGVAVRRRIKGMKGPTCQTGCGY